ncbi:RNA repair transcriptional activator RtcR [Myxococcota bacterium]|nr:RNA repair transcriptional activator RtcR [Myxococcota bacterium]MBU1430060.1 RNA repair transcriptional activator RtcR [Myxococcota bacterium]MBU1896299.1 RNA repair transcriptional activator RtcR [Myxococcota bacterium]
MRKKQVLIGLIGTKLDTPSGMRRWEEWRPSISLFGFEDLLIDRFVILHQARLEAALERIEADIHHISPHTTFERHCFDFNDPWDLEEVYDKLLSFADHYPFDPENEDYLFHITTGTHVFQICMFLLCEAQYLPGRLIQTSPPLKRRGPTWRIIDLDLSRYDAIAQRFAREQAARVAFLKAGIETRNAPFNQMMAEIEQVAVASTAPLLLLGPTGAGKTRLARRIYELKRLKKQVAGPLVEVNCATLRGDAAMSALFGHARGAFTGAIRERAGLLRQANGGLLFLDEIGELGLDEQAMLLRALEEKRFMPMGADEEVHSDFQLIAGTNRQLWREAHEGRFREDLLARIDLWTWRLPGLKDRREDLEPNLEYELREFSRKESRRVTFNREARQRFMRFAQAPSATWRGNFRDLNAAITRMATLAPGGRINMEGVEAEIQRLERSWQGGDSGPGEVGLVARVLGASVALDEFDRVQLEGVLAVCQRSRTISEAGRALFSVSREQKTTNNDADRLRKYLARFNLHWKDIKTDEEGA